MSSITLRRKIQLPKRPELICEAGGLVRKLGYIGQVECKPSIKIYPLEAHWEGRYPDPYTSCGGGDRIKDPRCAIVAPAASHPGVIMIDNYTYTLNIDIP